MKSCDGRFEVECSDYSEIRMGSPLFGSVEIHGLDRSFFNRLFGEAMAFSPDSQFFAIAELTGTRDGPLSRVIVIDLTRNREIQALPPAPGLFRRLTRNAKNELSILHWQSPYGESELTWSITDGPVRIG